MERLIPGRFRGTSCAMSAAPRPHSEDPSAPPPADAEGWALLDGLRRRLDEQANQHRKTQSQVSQLAESIAALVLVQRRRSRWLDINSFVAYLIFTVLCGGAFYLLYQSRARELAVEHDRVTRERDGAVARAKEASAQLTARDAAGAGAWETFQLLDAGKREEAAVQLARLAGAPLSKLERTVLDARARQAEVMQVDAALKAAAAAFKAGRHGEVVAPLQVALTLEPAGPRATLMRYYLGVAHARAGALDRAIEHLRAAVEGGVDIEDARFQLASALDRAGQWGKARVEYERFATKFPMSSYTEFATRRGGALARMPEVGPAAQAAPAARAGSTTPDATGGSPARPAASPPAVAPPRPAASPPAVAPPRPAAPASPGGSPASSSGQPATDGSPPAPSAPPAARTLDVSEPG